MALWANLPELNWLRGYMAMDPAFLAIMRFPLDGRDSLFVVLCWKTILKKWFGVATYFCFILKGKNKIRKKNPKYDS